MTDDISIPTSRHSLDEWALAVARGTPAPGGGAVAAVTGALAAALVEMVARMTLDRPRYQGTHPEMEQIAQAAEEQRRRMLELAKEDADAVVAKRHLAKTQIELAARARTVAQLARRAAEMGHGPAQGDAIMAALLLAAVARGAATNVALNEEGASRRTAGDPGTETDGQRAQADADAADREAGLAMALGQGRR